MADETSEEDKTEAASPRRLEKAREEGQVARSRELTTFMLLAMGLGTLWSIGGMFYGRLGQMMEQAFLFDRSQAFQVEPMLSKSVHLVQQSLLNLLPFFLAMTIVALVSPMLLGGAMISGKSLMPQLSRLNPMKGLKRIFSVQALIELAKVLAKATVFGGVLVLFLGDRLPEFIALMEQPLQQALLSSLYLLITTCGVLVLALFVVVLIDVPYQLWHHAKQLRMSKEELKREHKESDGDPMVKSRIRAQQQAMARQRMMSNLPSADVIITNPTHYAVALRYEDKGSSAPRVVAKGVDEVAKRIRLVGAEHSIPVLEAPPLARALYRHVDLEQEIPAQLYTAVAEVLAWVFSLRRARQEGGEVIAAPTNLPVPESMSE
ncbi:flagellar biosynthesis protein FlhB [Porticoccus sp.]